jgi:hypothetical protein
MVTPDKGGAGNPEELKLSEFLLLSALWMLFGFMLWYYTSVFHGAPARVFSEAILGALLDGDIARIIPQPDQRFLFQVETTIPFHFPDGSTEALGFVVNPLIYGFGLPLLFGLVMGSGVGWRRKFTLLGVGYAVTVLVQTWGVVFQSLKTLAFNFGEPTLAVIRAHGLSETGIALGYQVGTLILPSLAPILVWVLGNRKLVEHFVGWDAYRADRNRNP